MIDSESRSRLFIPAQRPYDRQPRPARRRARSADRAPDYGVNDDQPDQPHDRVATAVPVMPDAARTWPSGSEAPIQT